MMKLHLKLMMSAGVLALALLPATAVAAPGYHPAPGPTPPASSPPPHAKAYGHYCQGESKKHVKGEQGTAFSRCVKNMAQAATEDSKAPGQVCKGESKKHVKGEQGTAFSRCVKAVAKLRHDEHEDAS